MMFLDWFFLNALDVFFDLPYGQAGECPHLNIHVQSA